MKTVYIKVNSAGNCQPAHPNHKRHGCAVRAYRVDNVRDSVSATDVACKLNLVATWPADGIRNNDDASWVIDWAAVSSAPAGAIIRTGARNE